MAKHQSDSQNAFQMDSQMSFRNDTTSIYFNDFEGTLDWTSLDLTMPSGMWHVDDFNTPDGTGMAWWMGDTDINGYLDHTYLILDTPEILVPEGGHLTFDLNYNVEGTAGAQDPYNGWDGSNVRISTDGGASWSVIVGSPSYNSSSLYSFGVSHNEGPNIAGWGGSSNGWVSADFDLSSYSGQNVKIRFAFASDPAYCTVDNPSMFGVIVDNIVLGGFSNDGVDDGTMVAGSMVPVAGDLWHVYEDDTAPSPSHAVGCFDPSTNTYNPGMENYFISPEITLPNQSDALLFFDFSFKTGLDNGPFPDCDYLYVELENDGIWYSVSNPTGDPDLDNYVFTGDASIWNKWSEGYGYNNVTELAGQTIRFRVGLHSNADTPTTIGFHIDDFEVTEISYNVIPIVQNLNIYSEDSQVSLTWDMPPSAAYDNDEVANDDDDDGSGENSWALGAGTVKFGSVFDMPYGTESVVVHSARFAPNSLDDQPISAGIEAYNVSPIGIPEPEPVYTTTATLEDEAWTTVEFSNWTFAGDFLIALVVDSTVYMTIDEDATTAYSYIATSGAWYPVAAYDIDGEWLIRSNVTTTGTAVEPEFNVYRDPYPSGAWGLHFSSPWHTNEYTDYFLIENGTEYCYKVSAVYGAEESDRAGPVCATPESNTVYEIAYDDGSAETSYNFGMLNYFAVKFTPSVYPAYLHRANFYTAGTSNGTGLVHVWDDDGENGSPGTPLLNGIPTTFVANNWKYFSLSDFNITITEGSFYIGVMELDQTPPIGIDENNLPTYSFINISGGSSWEPLGNYFQGAFLVRAELDSINPLGFEDDLTVNIPESFGLKQNFPNPFNPTTTIEFDLASGAFASIILYDVTGREVKTLVNSNLQAGHYVFDLNASELSSGMYFYKLTAQNFDGQMIFSSTKKMVLMK
jgi:hypothetical protein